jgi:hypothetical protein
MKTLLFCLILLKVANVFQAQILLLEKNFECYFHKMVAATGLGKLLHTVGKNPGKIVYLSSCRKPVHVDTCGIQKPFHGCTSGFSVMSTEIRKCFHRSIF